MPTLVPLDNILGAQFIGIILSTILYGVTCLQAYLYYTQYSKGDSLRLKLFVALVVALDTLHVALISTAYYYYTVTNFGDYVALQRVTWSIADKQSYHSPDDLCIQHMYLALILSFVCVITWVTLGEGLIYVIFYWMLIRIYPCSFLSTLNSRETVRRAFQEDISARELSSLDTQVDTPDKDKDPAEVARLRRSSDRAFGPLTPNTPLPVYRLAEDGRNSGRVIASATSAVV
ncbi:uncharacterized protein B0H18DRAFT_1117486 [Fomitopsis serialis]|uniref:uncharacterized protein n=1 Tax=Fomitopsis serialis TaxID=139415 RepID=UPI002008D4BE|nr:uncharacterized protein B0H18DRAFT_1117486 [Neoantrodia serialis]KAH9929457.1 hypothetical protein B0H18DRAFT_1117486 [Neoantrodia serialis]